MLAEKRFIETSLAEASTNTTEVLSWGMISRGRLGTGRPKPEVEVTMFGKRKLKKIPRCESTPTVISRLAGQCIVDISAGTNHALAVSSSGEVYAWGCNSRGECGVVELDSSSLRRTELQRHRDQYNGVKEAKPPSLWDDVWVPRKIPNFGPDAGVTIASAAAGGIHSAAVDTHGLVYTWGGGGNSECLGHGDISSYEYGADEKSDALRRQVLAMSGCLKAPKWAVPRVLESIKHDKISHVSLGAKHGVALSSTGSMYVWGDESLRIQKVSGSVVHKFNGLLSSRFILIIDLE